MNDTIAAVSTPFGEGAIAVLRLSGPRAIEIADTVFRASTRVGDLEARRAQFGVIADDGRKLDEVLLTVFRGPASYTGEDVVEIAGHGGVLISRRLLELLLRQGARAAEPGEFTQRAYLHGKMDLTQAEAVMDLISAQTDLALQAATEQLEGRLGESVRALRDSLLELLAHIEACIDFPDEDIDPDTGEALRRRMLSLQADLAKLLATAGQGRVLREGVRTVIFGEPNVGKSSLLNRLLGTERAIVSARPGTTRDVIEEVIDLRGIPLRLVDTAGVHASVDEVELAGMERTRHQVERADLVLHVVDASEAAHLTSGQEALPVERALRVLNKIDLGEHESWRDTEGVRISCQTGMGFEDLADVIEARVLGGAARAEWTVAINARHQDCLQRAGEFLVAARQAFDDGLSPEFIAEELRSAMDAVGEVIGRVESDDVLGKIFSSFCIGK